MFSDAVRIKKGNALFIIGMQVLGVLLFGVLSSCEEQVSVEEETTDLLSLQGLQYSTSKILGQNSKPISAITPNVTPSIATVRYEVTPDLPTGLNLTSTGEISGTPNIVYVSTEHTITAEGTGNYTGSVSTKITIEVRALGCGVPLDTDGDGKYEIHTGYELYAIREELTRDYLLMQDIDIQTEVNQCTGGTYDKTNFTPIGFSFAGFTHDSRDRPFTGSFDGAGYTISGLKITGADDDYSIGLFGFIDGEDRTPPSIKNLMIDHEGISGKDNVGVLAGYVKKSTIEGVGMTSTKGSNMEGTGKVIGGLIGSLENSTVIGYATGAVSGVRYVGGLVGQIYGDESVVSGYVTSTVSGEYRVGGLVGGNIQANTTRVTGYATGAVSHSSAGDVGFDGELGGLVGYVGQDAILIGYARGSVTRAIGATSKTFGKLVGSFDQGANITGYHSTPRSTLENVGTDVLTGENGTAIDMGGGISETDFAGFTFGTEVGEWTWVASGQWPAINIGSFGEANGTADDQATEQPTTGN